MTHQQIETRKLIKGGREMKLIITADLREVNDQFLRGEITFSRAAEILNEIANKNLSLQIEGKFRSVVEHLTDPDMIEIYKRNNWTTKQICYALLTNHMGILVSKEANK